MTRHIWIILIFVFFPDICRPAFSGDLPQTYVIQWTSDRSLITEEGESISMPSFDQALHDAYFDYLPVFPLLFRNREIEDIDVKVLEMSPVRDHDPDLLAGRAPGSLPEVLLKNLRQDKTHITRVWILPFLRDTVSGEIFRIDRFSIQVHEKNKADNGDHILREGRKKARTFSGSSVLAEGSWFRLGIVETGVYGISYDDLISFGIDPGSIDPDRIRIFGNGGRMLPQANDMERPEDLIENPIHIRGDADGRFDPEDYILFYAEGPHKIGFKIENDEPAIEYLHHDYSDSSFYFLNISGEDGKRMNRRTDPGGSFPVISSFDHLVFHESDLHNLLSRGGSGSGREWYGELFQIKTRYEFPFVVPGLLTGEPIRLISSVLAKTYAPSQFTVQLNGQSLGSHDMDPVPDSRYSIKGRKDYREFELGEGELPDGTGQLSVSYEYIKASDVLSDGYLDYFNLWCRRALAAYPGQTMFRAVESLQQPHSLFSIQKEVQDFMVWDVTDPLAPVFQEYTDQGETVSFVAETETLRTFLIVEEGSYLEPVFTGEIPNQDLHGMPTPELLIISHPGFLPAAERLAIHRNSSGISAAVVSIDEVFNEFSSGALDVVAVRDFARYLYSRNPGLKYLLLFGRGTYDYKNIRGDQSSFVPIYQSRNSLHPIYSYASDDFFGFLDEDEGDWEETLFGDHIMDIGVGRFPVKTLDEAHTIVDKILIYETDPNCYGPWRNDLYFVADDGDGTDGTRHSRDADRLAVLVDTTYSTFNLGKIYVDAYPQNLLPNRQEAPEANKALSNAVKNGALIINYTGHGSEGQWTSENILNIATLNQWENLFHLPLLVTATCEFGRNDDPSIRSGAEFALTSKMGGAIGLVTTARPVFSSTNFLLNKSFYENVFEKNDGKYMTIGEIFRRTKNESLNGPVNRNFSLLGDPSMHLAYPDQSIVIDRINEQPLEDALDTLKALKKVNLSGKVLDTDHEVITGYRGVLTANVYDKPEMKYTLGTQDPVMAYEERKSLIFRGDVEVRNGEFEVEFIVPRNISYKVGDGKISMYAIDESLSTDAAGSNVQLRVGGSQDDFNPDDVPPVIELFLEDTTFTPGDITSDHPEVFARLYDDSGINIIENDISKGLLLILDEEQEFVINNFYKSDLNDYRRGAIRYQLSELETGLHTLRLRAWDTHNNMADATTEFYVGERNELLILNLINYPNPFRQETRFSFEHNRSGEPLSVTISIFSVRGELVKTITAEVRNSDFRINDIHWDGRAGDGKKLESGIYIYRVFLRSLLDGAKNAAFEKLVIIN